jgi:hypothetical protein
MRPEDQLQLTVVKFLQLSGLTFTATANGAFLQGDARQRAIRGARMKAHGVSNGVPDILIFNQCFSGSERGLAIELKVGKNKPTDSQLEWHYKLRKCGWRVEVLRTFDEAVAVIKECYPNSRCAA